MNDATGITDAIDRILAEVERLERECAAERALVDAYLAELHAERLSHLATIRRLEAATLALAIARAEGNS